MAETNGQSSCKTVLASTIAKSLQREVQDGLASLDTQPHLVGFLANDDPAAQMYADWTAKTCKEKGFAFSLRRVDREDLEEAILAANTDSTVHGIIVYYPIFNNRQDQYLQNIVDVSKDVEGLSHRYIFNMYQNIRYLDATTTDDAALAPTPTQKSILPCTPLAVIKILEHLRVYNTILPAGNRLFGRSITVINRSEVVGRPLAALLANDGAHVYSVDATGVQEFTRGQGIKRRRHEATDLPGWGLEQCLQRSDVVVSGVPGEFKVPLGLVRDGAVCVNFSSERNFDPEVKERASIYVPAIGKVTIVILLRNLLRLLQNQKRKDGSAEAPNNTPSSA